MAKPWVLEDGLNLVRALQPECRQFGYHLCLGGGLLNKGYSEKDIDLYFLPMESRKGPKVDDEGLVGWLSKMWGSFEVLGAGYGISHEILFNLDPINAQFLQQPNNPNAPFIWAPARHPDPPQLSQSEPSVYKHKLKFIRQGGDRIDVFIM